jgi:hypothetical protein
MWKKPFSSRRSANIPLGNAIREARLANGIGQEKLGISRSGSQRHRSVDRGDNNLSVLTQVAQIATALETSIARFMQKAAFSSAKVD